MPNLFNEDAKNVLSLLPNNIQMDNLASFFKVFGDSTRIKMLFILLHGELCVNDLATILNMNQPAISHQLRILRENRIVKCRKQGKMSYYSLDDEHVSNILTQGIKHISHGFYGE